MAESNTDSKSSNQMWGGRFASGPDAIMEEINASIGFDKKLFAQDIRGSIAHATMLAHQGIISAEDKDKIVHGLNTILSEIESGNFEFSRRLEDIHMNIEARLATLIGPAAGRLHTARSRNDQVALDFRLWVKEELEKTEKMLTGLIAAFLNPLAFAGSGATADEAAGAIIRGVTRQLGNEIDEFVTEALRNNLLGLPL
ncbi:lyase family protein, partial [Rhizobium phaseoli]